MTEKEYESLWPSDQTKRQPSAMTKCTTTVDGKIKIQDDPNSSRNQSNQLYESHNNNLLLNRTSTS
jgi:hypothetical protein